MKRLLFAFSLLALMLTGFSSLQAQNPNALASPATSGMTQFDAYKMNFTAAVNLGNTTMADPHRIKLVRFMERQTAAAEAVATAAGATQKAKDDVVRLKEIIAEFNALDLSTVDALNAAKTKLPLIDEFGRLTGEKSASTN